MTQQIIPEKAPSGYVVQRPYWVERLQEEKERSQFKIENVHFVHDPNWRANFISCQRVGDWWRDDVIRAGCAPYVSAVGYVEDYIFWTWFDLVNPQRKEHYRPKSLPPKLALA